VLAYYSPEEILRAYFEGPCFEGRRVGYSDTLDYAPSPARLGRYKRAYEKIRGVVEGPTYELDGW